MADGSLQTNAWPLPKFYFAVDIPGVGTDLPFQEVSGLEAETSPIEYRHGDRPGFYPIKMPGLGKVRNVTLTKGVVANGDAILSWFAGIKMGRIEPRTITIKLLDQRGQVAMRWSLLNAWPVKVSSTDVASDANAIALEHIELATEGWEVDASVSEPPEK